jgi:hypothetical protein
MTIDRTELRAIVKNRLFNDPRKRIARQEQHMPPPVCTELADRRCVDLATCCNDKIARSQRIGHVDDQATRQGSCAPHSNQRHMFDTWYMVEHFGEMPCQPIVAHQRKHIGSGAVDRDPHTHGTKVLPCVERCPGSNPASAKPQASDDAVGT